MKKVLIFGMSGTLGGVETYLYNLIKNIDHKKYKFDYLIIGKERSVFEEELNALECDGNSHFYKAPNIKRHPILGRNWLRDFYDTHQYDYIYMNTCTAARIKYAEYCIIKYHTPLIVHSHSGNAASILNRFSNNLYRKKITKFSSVHLACSEVAYGWMFTDEYNSNSVVPNGVDLQRFRFELDWRREIRNLLGVNDDDILIGNVGRFSYPKNQIYFIKLAEKLPNCYKIVIIGDGELKEELIKKIQEAGLEKRFIVLPVQNNIEKYYSAMDIFVMPSIFEGLPIVGVEAQATGLPCVLSTNVSRQTAMSNRVEFVDLDDLNQWIDAIKNVGSRYDGTKVVMENGFDNMKSVKMIEKLFESIGGTDD